MRFNIDQYFSIAIIDNLEIDRKINRIFKDFSLCFEDMQFFDNFHI